MKGRRGERGWSRVGGSRGSRCLGTFLRIFSEPCLTGTALEWVSALGSELTVGTKCEVPRMSQFFGVSLGFTPLRWRKRDPLQPYSWSSSIRCLPPAPLKHPTSCRGSSSLLIQFICVVTWVSGTQPSLLRVPQASPASSRAQGVENCLGRVCPLPRNREGSRLALGVPQWGPNPTAVVSPSLHPGQRWGLPPFLATACSVCCSLLLLADRFRKVNGIEKAGCHQLKPEVPPT